MNLALLWQSIVQPAIAIPLQAYACGERDGQERDEPAPAQGAACLQCGAQQVQVEPGRGLAHDQCKLGALLRATLQRQAGNVPAGCKPSRIDSGSLPNGGSRRKSW
jgi:hypothetical protein